MNWFVHQSQSCLCHITQPIYCHSHFIASVTPISVDTPLNQYNENNNQETVYNITVGTIYKGGDWASQALADSKLYTGSSGFDCTVHLDLNNNYIVGGSIHGSKPFIDECDYYKKQKWLNQQDYQALESGFELGCHQYQANHVNSPVS